MSEGAGLIAATSSNWSMTLAENVKSCAIKCAKEKFQEILFHEECADYLKQLIVSAMLKNYYERRDCRKTFCSLVIRYWCGSASNYTRYPYLFFPMYIKLILQINMYMIVKHHCVNLNKLEEITQITQSNDLSSK